VFIREGEGSVCLAAAPDLAPGNAADGLGPAERRLDTLSDPLADGVAGMGPLRLLLQPMAASLSMSSTRPIPPLISGLTVHTGHRRPKSSSPAT
jgi:hypothetical protein